MDNLWNRRFQELTDEAEKLEASKRNEYNQYLNCNVEQIDSNKLLTWKVKAKNLLAKACDGSPHYKHFEDEESSPYSTSLDNLCRMKAVFQAAREDFEGGYLASMRGLVRAEVFSSELEQASELFNSRYIVAAAVIAGVVLETAIRDLCVRNQVPVAMLGKMNDELAKKGVYNSLVQKRITALAAIRNSAAHGKQDEFTNDDVKAMIGEVERFLAQHIA
jgi:hypothetical protein